MDKVYYDVRINDTTRYRLFEGTIDERELLWHQDQKDREVQIFEGNDWKIQFDDQLPTTLEKGMVVKIESHTYHRVIKGKGDLIIKIKE